ncbi:hypothetical protein [Micromonospora sp. NPDC048830]|uniref:hypothetical protein n=1 Tax=Micromonospora sp. NPDC048830 TaxID=3364257 RepID=UPI00371F7283
MATVGHGDQALETAWADYRKHPDRYSYDHLMTFVPHAERPGWHDRAITEALDGDRYLPAVIEPRRPVGRVRAPRPLRWGASLPAGARHRGRSGTGRRVPGHPDCGDQRLGFRLGLTG